MKRLFLFSIAVSLFFILSAPMHSQGAMTDYCLVPPYVIQNIAPNVMIVVDNSGSMFYFSYFDGFTTNDTGDDNLCTNSTSPCIEFTTPGTYPNYKFYGYFNPDYWYDYSSNRFYPTAPKTGSGISGERAKNSTEWDGNFLNWVTMRRIDIIRKVLTGGKKGTGEGSGYDRILGELADCDSRGRYKRIGDASLYTPYTGTRKLVVNTAGGSCNGSGSGTSSLTVRNSTDTGNESTFNVSVRVPSPVEGVLQEVVGTRARIGLSFYNVNASTPQGGSVRVPVTGGSLSSTVNEINLTRPDSNTPLAETLWMVAGYFAQQASALSGPGPRYNTSDFQINNNNDPYNYGTGTPRWPACSKSYVLYITDGEPCADGYLPATISDYASGCLGTSCNSCSDTGCSPYNCSDTSCPSVGSFPAASLPSCSAGGNVAGIEDVALWAHTTDLRNNPTLGINNMSGIQSLGLYVIYAFGKGSTLLRYAAINGGFEDLNGNNIPDQQSEWDNNGDGEPDTFYEADEGYALEASIREAFTSILKRASSGTAASVLASGEGRGANLVQAVFYPKRRFGNDIISWTGENQNLWYYVDPFFANSSIREDTQPDQQLHLVNDYIVQLYFDNTSQLTKARRYIDTDGDGDADTQTTTVPFENILNLWEAGKLLWSRDISTDPRTIYTTINGSSFLSGGFTTANESVLRPYLDVSTDTLADYLIRFTQGEGLTTKDLDGDGTTDVFGIDLNGDGVDDYRDRMVTIGSDTKVWKLGDVIDSTPRIASWVPLNTYYTTYNDQTYKDFTDSTEYRGRGMVFSGGNDGMLHAFKLGNLEIVNSQYVKARLTGSDIGKEAWAFIPKNALPYLKYIADPEYCHLYTVDLTAYIFDASVSGNPDDTKTVNSWRTILIGGMRFGGACRNYNSSCTDCIKTPIDGVGYSSYFALDVTDMNNPQLLWEFSDPELGFTTTGPSVVRIGDRSLNGHWYVVFGSGPTGPVDTTNLQFLGRSDQNLKLFVLDLETGSLLRKIDTGIQYAFAGSMYNSTNDTDLNYQDDVIYIGYVKKCTATTSVCTNGTWTNGGIGRLITKENTDPATWAWSTVIDGIGAVTSSIARLQNKFTNTLWLFFGSGRFFYVQTSTTDDADSQRTLFGIKEPCYSSAGISQTCTTSVSAAQLTNVTDINDVPESSEAESTSFKGWKINLDLSGNYTYLEGESSVTHSYKAERVITDPLATISGIVFYTSYKPYSDECAIGGKTFLWAVKYDTGGAGGALLKGIALIQVSTAAIEQINLSSAFTRKGGRCTAAMEGVPPTAQGLSLITMPPPVKRVIHLEER
jgi:type IV pilus assembly protein PilY1